MTATFVSQFYSKIRADKSSATNFSQKFLFSHNSEYLVYYSGLDWQTRRERRSNLQPRSQCDLLSTAMKSNQFGCKKELLLLHYAIVVLQKPNLHSVIGNGIHIKHKTGWSSTKEQHIKSKQIGHSGYNHSWWHSAAFDFSKGSYYTSEEDSDLKEQLRNFSQ